MRFIFIFVSKIIQLLPSRLIISSGLSLAWIAQKIVRFRLPIIKNQLDVTFGKTKTASEMSGLISDVYRHLFLTLIEILQLPSASIPDMARRVNIRGFENIQSALNRKKGVLILTGHIGNWELAGIALVNKGLKVSAIAKEMKSNVGNIMIDLIRDSNGNTTIPRKNSMKNILKSLKNNEVIVVILDQNMTAKDGVFVDFFGYKASTMTSLAVIAKHTGAAIVPAYTYRNNDLFHHDLIIEPELKLENKFSDKDKKIAYNTQVFTTKLEHFIVNNPAQWIWLHKRWRTRPLSEDSCPFVYARTHIP